MMEKRGREKDRKENVSHWKRQKDCDREEMVTRRRRQGIADTRNRRKGRSKA